MSRQVATVRFFYSDGDRNRSGFAREDITVISRGKICVLFGRRYRGNPFQKIFSIQPGIALSKHFPSGKFWVTYFFEKRCPKKPSGSDLFVRCTCYRRDNVWGFMPCNTVEYKASVVDYQEAIQVYGHRILNQLPTELKKELFRGFF